VMLSLLNLLLRFDYEKALECVDLGRFSISVFVFLFLDVFSIYCETLTPLENYSLENLRFPKPDFN